MTLAKRVPKKALALALALCLAWGLALPALAIVVPERPENQYVLDEAGVLSEETEQEIITQNQSLFEETGAQIAVAAVDFSAFAPPERDPDVIPCASEKEARFITPDVDVGETIECSPDLMEDILAAEEEAPQGALKIAILEEDDLDIFAENQYVVKDALCLWSDVPELLEKALRLYQGRAFWDGTGDLDDAFLEEMSHKYGLVLL